MKKYELDQSIGSAPLYGQIKQIIINEIKNGTYKVNSFIPTEKELQEMFGVSRMTIRLAIDALVTDGYVVKERPKGTRVLEPKIVENLNVITGFNQEMKEKNMDSKLEFVSIEVSQASELVCDKLNIQRGSDVYHLHRVYSVNGELLNSIYDHLPLNLDLPLDQNVYRGSLYEYLKKEKGIIISKVNEDISVGYANSRLAKELGVKVGSPLLKRTRVSFDQNKNIVEFVDSYYRPDKYMYSVSFGNS